ncbi:hypothetical protein CJP74_07860, partial [Psittacicella melopsittaci]
MISKKDYRQIVDKLLQFRFQQEEKQVGNNYSLEQISQLTQELKNQVELFQQVAPDLTSLNRIEQDLNNLIQQQSLEQEKEILEDYFPVVFQFIERALAPININQVPQGFLDNSLTAVFPQSYLRQLVGFRSLLAQLLPYVPQSYSQYKVDNPKDTYLDYIVSALAYFEQVAQSNHGIDYQELIDFLDAFIACLHQEKITFNWRSLEILLISLLLQTRELKIRYTYYEMRYLISQENLLQDLQNKLNGTSYLDYQGKLFSDDEEDQETLLYFQNDPTPELIFKLAKKYAPEVQERIFAQLQLQQLDLLDKYASVIENPEANIQLEKYIQQTLGQEVELQEEDKSQTSKQETSRLGSLYLDRTYLDEQDLVLGNVKLLSKEKVQEDPYLSSMFSFLGYDIFADDFSPLDVIFNSDEYTFNGIQVQVDDNIREEFLAQAGENLDFQAIKAVKELSKLAILKDIYQAVLYEKLHAAENNLDSPLASLDEEEIFTLFSEAGQEIAQKSGFNLQEYKTRVKALAKHDIQADEAEQGHGFKSYSEESEFENKFIRQELKSQNRVKREELEQNKQEGGRRRNQYTLFSDANAGYNDEDLAWAQAYSSPPPVTLSPLTPADEILPEKKKATRKRSRKKATRTIINRDEFIAQIKEEQLRLRKNKLLEAQAEKEKEQQAEQERLAQERLVQQRLEQERLEQERLEQERLEQERL